MGLVTPRDVPLAAHVSAVTCRPQSFRDGHTPVIQSAAVAVMAVVAGHVTDAGLMRMQTGEQRGSRGAAARGVVELREPDAAGRQGIEIGRLDLPAVTAKIGEAHVVAENHDDVRLLRGKGLTADKAKEGHKRRKEAVHEFTPCDAQASNPAAASLVLVLHTIRSSGARRGFYRRAGPSAKRRRGPGHLPSVEPTEPALTQNDEADTVGSGVFAFDNVRINSGRQLFTTVAERPDEPPCSRGKCGSAHPTARC